jgi:hypothetical protein
MMPTEPVVAIMNYCGEKPGESERYFYDPGPAVVQKPVIMDRREVGIADIRDMDEAFSVDEQGFALIACPDDVTFGAEPGMIRESFYPAMERLVRDALGAERVVAFDHDFRTTTVTAETDYLRGVVPVVHNDYTEVSGPQRVRDLMPADDLDGLLSRRFAFINVWKPISYPAEDKPLGMCDARSIRADDFITTYMHYRDRTGEVYALRYNPDHHWFYVRAMRPDEAILLKVFDSDKVTPARFTPHSAFTDPTMRPDAPPRRSIEVRVIAFFG